MVFQLDYTPEFLAPGSLVSLFFVPPERGMRLYGCKLLVCYPPLLSGKKGAWDDIRCVGCI